MATALADVLDVTQRHTSTLASALVDYLRTKHSLIVLDNCEHVTAATAETGRHAAVRPGKSGGP